MYRQRDRCSYIYALDRAEPTTAVSQAFNETTGMLEIHRDDILALNRVVTGIKLFKLYSNFELKPNIAEVMKRSGVSFAY